jgi:type IV pilus biogenesis protein CpaD/CtpE
MQRFRHLIAAAFLAALVAGCASTPPKAANDLPSVEYEQR